ncbi:MAG: AAA family ATPase [Candidatus Kapabacteria bacterium]|jgi:predicted ATP-binding protein involved in virulence|nr:AAA family ATPase [Candidatus Kapabacteria bacterium]
MRITSLHLQNVGVFDDTTIEFPADKPENCAEIHLFTGANGSGKSTVLYALAASIFHNAMMISRMKKNVATSTAKIQFSSGQNEVLSYTTKNGFHIQNRPFHDLHQAFNGIYHEGMRFDFFAAAYSGNRSVSSISLQAIQEISHSPFVSALSFHDTVEPVIILQWIANTNAKIANAYFKGQHERVTRLQTSIQRIESAVGEIIDKKVSFIFEDDPKLDVKIRIGEEVLSFDVLPDGVKSVLSWIADLLMRLDRINWAEKRDVLDQNFILFLDEIEIHLHPAWQRKVLPVVQKLFRHAQIFIATHSPFVIGSVSGAWVYKLTVPSEPLVKPLRTDSADSVDVILEEIFGVDEQFGEDIEKKFSTFYEIRKEMYAGIETRKQELMRLAEELSQRSEQTRNIVSRELRQLERVLQRSFQITGE